MQGNVPHVARNVWPNDILEFVLIEELHSTNTPIIYKHLLFAEPHVASNVRYIAFPLSTNSLLTPCLEEAFTSPYASTTLPFKVAELASVMTTRMVWPMR